MRPLLNAASPVATLVGLALALPAGAQTPVDAPAATPEPSAPADPGAGPDLGGPLSVNGVEIPQNEIERFIIYGSCRPALEYRRINAMIEWELSLRSAEGQDMSRYEITDEAFEKHYDKKIQEFVAKFPMLDVETEVRRAYRDLDWYRQELRQEMVFDEVFVTDNPELWPEVTFEALRQEAGDILIDDFKESYERRLKFTEDARAEWQAKKDAGEDPGPYPEMQPEDSMYRSILRQIVRDAYFQIVDTKTSKDGLPDDLVVTMDFDFDGKPELSVSTAEMWDAVKHTVSPKEISDARLFLALEEATRQRLASEGLLMSDEEAKQALEEVAAGFTSGMFDLSQVAVGGHEFPSVESYATYLPLYESWKRSVMPRLQTEDGSLPPELQDHLDEANKVMGLANTDAEVLLVSAFDFPNFRWKQDGWEWAENKAKELKKDYDDNLGAWDALQKGGPDAQAADGGAPPLEPSVFWSLLIDDHCEFWDPPQPVQGRPGSAVGYKQKGRFGERTRNDMRSLMSESPFTQYLYGGTLTDQIFFEQPIGEVQGPFVGPWGYYLTKVLRRTPPTRPLNIRNEKHVDLLRDDYLRVAFIWYSHAAFDKADVAGLPR